MIINITWLKIVILGNKNKANMNNKENIWNAIQYIKIHAPDSGYLDIREEFSKVLNENEINLLRSLLVGNGLIRMNDNNQWQFQLTAKAILLEKKNIKRNGVVKQDNRELFFQLKIAIISALIGGCLGTFLSPLQEWMKEKLLKPSSAKTIILPPNQLIRDTIYINKNK